VFSYLDTLTVNSIEDTKTLQEQRVVFDGSQQYTNPTPCMIPYNRPLRRPLAQSARIESTVYFSTILGRWFGTEVLKRQSLTPSYLVCARQTTNLICRPLGFYVDKPDFLNIVVPTYSPSLALSPELGKHSKKWPYANLTLRELLLSSGVFILLSTLWFWISSSSKLSWNILLALFEVKFLWNAESVLLDLLCTEALKFCKHFIPDSCLLYFRYSGRR